MTPNDLLTVAEVSKILKISQFTIREWLRTGKLTGKKIGHQWRVRLSDVEALT